MSINVLCQTRTAAEEPTPGDLAAIEADMPLIEAGIDLVDAECRVLANPADVLARRAHRRAISALQRLLIQQANHAAQAASTHAATYPGPADPAEAA